MTPQDDETLFAYVDGELDAAARARFEAILAVDATLAQRVAEQLQLRRQLGNAFDPTLLEPVPERLRVAALRVTPAAAPVVALPSVTRQPRVRGPSSMTWFATAASLVLGILLGQRWSSTSGALVVADANGTVARAALAEALDTHLQSVPRRGRDPVRIGISYLAQSGEYCRTFTITGSRATEAGVACRTAGNEWRIAIIEATAGTTVPSGAVRPASSMELPESVRRAVEATIVGDALDAAGEAAARDAGWQVNQSPK